MKKFLVYLVVIVLVVSLGFTVFYFVRDNEIISISSASVYKDVGDKFALDVVHKNKKSGRSISVTSSDDEIVSGSYNAKTGQYNAEAKKGGVARVNVRTDSVKFRNLWCDVIVGDGSVEAPFYISTAEQLQAIGMGDPVYDEHGQETGVYYGAKGYEKYRSDLCYKLVDNINVSTINNGYWVPLRNFSGRFDGNGMTLSNIYIDAVEYRQKNADSLNLDIHFSENDDAGLFANILPSGIVYNLKIDSFTAIGTYGKFGVIAGSNSGVIERIEVNNAYLSVKSVVLGGLVGENVSTKVNTTVKDKDGHDQIILDRDIARIDRCSITELTLGQKINATDGSKSVLGAQGIIGGLIGTNKGGTLVYSYVRGEVYFADDASSPITYGGVVAENLAEKNFPVVGDYVYAIQGANIKDCYSDIKTILDTTTASISPESTFAGAIAKNVDYSNGVYEDSNYSIVNNYILGVYYNLDNLNFAQEGKTKNFIGVAQFTMDSQVVDFEDTKTIVYGYTPASEMAVATNFVSHITKVIEFNEDGVSKGVVEKEVLWLFDTVWAIDSAHNDGLPYLNFQLIYVPDDFGTVGIPTVANALDEFKYQVQVDYPVAILSGTNDKLYMTVGEVYQLQYSPAGISLNWSTTDDSVVDVDANGILTAKKKGVVTITATTKTGRTDSITVIVENIVYSFMNAPESITIKVGQSYNLGNIYLNPTPADGDIAFAVENGDIATYDNKTLTGMAVGETSLVLTFGSSKLVIPVTVQTAVKTPVTISASPRTIEGTFNKLTKTGTITLSASQTLDYSIEYTTGTNAIVETTLSGNTINYTIKGTGNVVLNVKGSNDNYEGNVDIHFNIYDEVVLTANPSFISGDYSNINKTGTIQISNNLGKTFTYTATSGDSNVAVSINGNKLTYTIKGTVSTNVVVTIDSANYDGSVSILFNIYQTATPSMVLNYRNASIYVGNTLQLKPVSGNYTLPITYTTNNSQVATVTTSGEVKGLSVGSVTITASSQNGATATCVVTVSAVDKASVKFKSTSTYTIEVGKTLDLKKNISGNWDSLAWKSANSNVASVNNGVVTGVNVGQTTITITASKNGTTATIKATVNVIAKNIEIILDPTSAMAEPGTSVEINATVANSSNAIKWTYSNNQYIDGTPVETNRSTEVTIVNDTDAIGKTITVTATIDSTSVSMTITIAKDGYVFDYDTLNAMRYNPSKSYILVADINVGAFAPIENFTGSFTAQKNSATGEYYTLNNIIVNGSYAYAGLFANIKSNARITNIIIANSTINATVGAGGLVGKIEDNSTIAYCEVRNTVVNGGQYAGGIVGYSRGSYVSNSDVIDCTVTATTNTTSSAVGGIVGYTTSSITRTSVKNTAIKVSSTAHGNVGGIAGTSTKTIDYSSVTGGTIQTGNKDIDFAGGIVGYTTGKISACIVGTGLKVSGYNIGGIGGEINVSRKIILTFSELKKGFRYGDIKTYKDATTGSTYVAPDVEKVAVHNGVTLTGTNVGGLFSIIKSGVVSDCYTQASLVGNGSSAVIAGFAKAIEASGFTNEGSKSTGGQVGIVINCYSACTFSGTTTKGGKFAISASTVHNYEGYDGLIINGDDNTKSTGYVFKYVFDKDKASGTSYYASSNGKDSIGAKKSTSDMKNSSTYSDSSKAFSGAVWKFDGDYPTLSCEVSVRGY